MACNLCIECNERVIFSKKKCQKCYDKFRWDSLREYYRKNPEEKIADGKRRYALKRKRAGLSYDKSLDLTAYNRQPGEGTVTVQGYRRLTMRGHPNCQKNDKILEHVYVMSLYLKRPLRKGETVHHKNGNRLDNRIENLELFSHAHGPGQSVKDKMKWCREFIKQYESEFPDSEEKK